ncbi:MAG: hypothetical protein M3Y64_03065 [Gemmatimonadota bacterium]|nr:hypothetical protein [Gemmatimonadota bacterium]
MSLQSWQETLVSAQVDGTAHTTIAALSVIPAAAKYTLPANFFSIGKQLRILATGRISTVVTSPGSMRFDVRFGATVVFDGQAVALSTADAYTNQTWVLDILLTCRAIGAGTSTTMFGQGTLATPNVLGVTATPPKSYGLAGLPWNTAPVVGTGVDCTVTQAVDLFFTQTVNTHSLTLHQYSLIAMN